MSGDEYLRAVLYLLLVLGLIAGCTWILRRYGGRFQMRGRGRLGLVEIASIDPRRRLVLVRRDDVEHLLLLGPVQDLVIESNIPAPRFVPSDAPDPEAGP
jgi:flagellar protein FliO/FliZ